MSPTARHKAPAVPWYLPLSPIYPRYWPTADRVLLGFAQLWTSCICCFRKHTVLTSIWKLWSLRAHCKGHLQNDCVGFAIPVKNCWQSYKADCSLESSLCSLPSFITFALLFLRPRPGRGLGEIMADQKPSGGSLLCPECELKSSPLYYSMQREGFPSS